MKKFFVSCGRFLKRNVYYVILVASVLAIGALVAVSVSMSQAGPVLELPESSQPDDSSQNQTPEDPDDDDPDQPTDTDPIVFILPLESYTMGTDYSGSEFVYSATLKEFTQHTGVDFKADEGTPVLAVYEGVVESVTQSLLDGTTVVIKHNDELFTVYQSLDSEVQVEKGDRVKAGDIIGKVATCYNELLEGPHLHFEVLFQSAAVDPMEYFDLEEK